MNVLFFTVSLGGGHLKAAEAIKEAIDAKYKNSKTLIVDALKYVNPLVDKLVVGSYLNTVKATPKLYGKLYEISESGDNIYDLSKAVNKLLSYKLRTLIQEFNPSIIVCTHPFPLQMLSNLKKKNKISTPVVAILTDYAFHPFWSHEKTDAYIVAHEYMKHEMISRGVQGNIIYPYGMPVSNKFLIEKSSLELKKEFGLKAKPTVLLMGGSLGFGEIKDVFHSLLKYENDIQIIAITGKNTKLKNQLEKRAAMSNKLVKVLGYTDRVHDYMSVSDFIITKPGGITIAESLVKKLPMFIISPIPGQEEENANFLLNNGLAARIFENDDAGSTLFQVMDNPLRIRHMKEMAESMSKLDSCNKIIELMESLIHKTPAQDS